ncbi:MAG: DNA adenine methylase [Candidatus Hodarchaeota archaeon]
MKSPAKREITSPLRYPGGKSKSLHKIMPNIYSLYKEFREPFVGGGSVFLAAMQRINPKALYKINDLNYDVYCFWKELKENGIVLISEIQKIKNKYNNGKELFQFLTSSKKERTDLERAIRFFILNRITFSGTTDSGGYSEQAFLKRFTKSSIQRLKPLPRLLEKVIIKHGDYEKLLFEPNKDVFIFLDPPYFSAAKSKLYGKNGDLHTSFDHERFANNVEKCRHKWLITYDDCQEIRDLFSFADIYEWKAQYGMNNVSKKKAEKGRELFVTNYELKLKTQMKISQF